MTTLTATPKSVTLAAEVLTRASLHHLQRADAWRRWDKAAAREDMAWRAGHRLTGYAWSALLDQARTDRDRAQLALDDLRETYPLHAPSDAALERLTGMDVEGRARTRANVTLHH